VILYFARHAESQANVDGVFANDTSYYGLTERGVQQAQHLGAELLTVGITHAFASPLRRAQETAQIVCEILGIECETSSELKEFSVGALEGCASPDHWQQLSDLEHQWMTGKDPDARLGGGECLEDVRSRFSEFMDQLIARYSFSDQKILCVGHGGTLVCALPPFLDNVTEAFALDHPIRPTGLIVARQAQDCFHCLRWTDTIFLDAVPR
jgi:probable phosphoglycerate mutase